MKFFLPLMPRVLKNSKKLVRVGGRLIPISSNAARTFMAEASKLLKPHALEIPISSPIRLRQVFYGPWGDGSLPDLSNLYQALEDSLQRDRILADDCWIDSHDGSRRVRMCPGCPRIPVIKAGPRKGQPKDGCGCKRTCPYVGILVELTPYDDSELAQLCRERRQQVDGQEVDV